MKSFFYLAALSVALPLSAADQPVNPGLAEIKTVYLLPMTYSLDQFLAIRLTKGGAVQVVTDPKLADAVLTDHIGTGLEDRLKSLYGDKKPDPEVKDADKERGTYSNPMAGGTRSRGAVFLVDRKTRNVVWSDYVRPKSAQPDELSHVADRIAGQLEKDKKVKKEK
jgi:hypothetical protein